MDARGRLRGPSGRVKGRVTRVGRRTEESSAQRGRAGAVDSGQWKKEMGEVGGRDKEGTSSEKNTKGGGALGHELVQRGEQIIGSVLAEISENCFYEDMRFALSGEETDKVAATEARKLAMQEAVARRKEEFDDKLLLALEAYIGAAQNLDSSQSDELLPMLEMLRQEILDVVQETLPLEIQCIEALYIIADDAVRANTVAKAFDFPSYDSKAAIEEGVPKADPERVLAILNRLIDDMENVERVVDWGLLARMCMLREDLRENIVDEMVLGEGDGVSKQDITFIKELISVGDPMRRQALLKAAFNSQGMTMGTSHGTDAAATPELPNLIKFTDAKPKPLHNVQIGSSGPPKVAVGIRPGRFLNATRLLQVEMKVEGVKYGPQTPEQEKASRTPIPILNRLRQNEAVCTRINEIVVEARRVLKELSN